jgi:hypothetical protein
MTWIFPPGRLVSHEVDDVGEVDQLFWTRTQIAFDLSEGFREPEAPDWRRYSTSLVAI